MQKRYHVEITHRALEAEFSRPALAVILEANLRQDNLLGQLFHPEYHFDNNGLAQGRAYIARQRQLVLDALAGGEAQPAWSAFGRLAHAAQDFYAHSNYVRLWLGLHASPHPNSQFLPPNSQSLPPNSQFLIPTSQIAPLDPEILNSPSLHSERMYYPWEVLSFVGLETLMRRLLPPDSHTRMNLDSPKSGPLFPYALSAAIQRTVYEFESLRGELSPEEMACFIDQ